MAFVRAYSNPDDFGRVFKKQLFKFPAKRVVRPNNDQAPDLETFAVALADAGVPPESWIVVGSTALMASGLPMTAAEMEVVIVDRDVPMLEKFADAFQNLGLASIDVGMRDFFREYDYEAMGGFENPTFRRIFSAVLEVDTPDSPEWDEHSAGRGVGPQIIVSHSPYRDPSVRAEALQPFPVVFDSGATANVANLLSVMQIDDVNAKYVAQLLTEDYVNDWSDYTVTSADHLREGRSWMNERLRESASALFFLTVLEIDVSKVANAVPMGAPQTFER